MIHTLKSWTGEFEAVRDGRKTHEVRVQDRPFAVGDMVILREWIPVPASTVKEGKYTERRVLRHITYITPGGAWGLPDKICVLSIQP
jgi:ASC-1-like (ASCH) protein